MKATFDQYLRLGEMIQNGSLDRETVQALIEGRIEIRDRPREQTGSPYRGDLPQDDGLPPDHYRIRVNRGPLPSFAELESEYGKGNVSSLFDGRPWTKHAKRLEHDVTAEEVVILVKDFALEIESGEITLDKDGYLLTEDLIAWGLKHGYTPCDEKETYAVGRDEKTRDLQRKNWSVALGSSAAGGGGRCVAVLDARGRDRVLYGGWDGDGWGRSDRFLFARKSA
ncbi:MAG: hypothetical protein AAB923_04010 [Patescibacteria group bacterium]